MAVDDRQTALGEFGDDIERTTVVPEDLAAHPVVLLDFIAEFMPEYRARFL